MHSLFASAHDPEQNKVSAENAVQGPHEFTLQYLSPAHPALTIPMDAVGIACFVKPSGGIIIWIQIIHREYLCIKYTLP